MRIKFESAAFRFTADKCKRQFLVFTRDDSTITIVDLTRGEVLQLEHRKPLDAKRAAAAVRKALTAWELRETIASGVAAFIEPKAAKPRVGEKPTDSLREMRENQNRKKSGK